MKHIYQHGKIQFTDVCNCSSLFSQGKCSKGIHPSCVCMFLFPSCVCAPFAYAIRTSVLSDPNTVENKPFFTTKLKICGF